MDDSKGNKKDHALAITIEDWESMFNTVTDCITVHDADFNIVRMNQSARKMLGLQHQQQITTVKCFQCYHGTANPPADCPSCLSLKTGRPATVEIFEPFLDKHIEIRALPRFGLDGQVSGVIHIVRDITDRNQTEKALRESEKAARQLAQENGLIADIGKIISSTLNIGEVYERFAEEVRKAIPFDRITVSTANIKDNTRTVRYVSGSTFSNGRIGQVIPLSGSGTEQVMRTRASMLINSKNREEMVVKFPGMLSLRLGAQSMMVVPLISKDEVMGAMSIQSARIDAYSEHELRLAEKVGAQITGAIANAQLFLERNEAGEERRILSERLQRAEKMEALGQLAGGVAHDLNNVLSVLSGYSELLMDMAPAGTALKEYASRILKSCEKGAAIIDDLLTLARRGIAISTVLNINNIITSYLMTPAFEYLQTYHPQVIIKTALEKDLLPIKGSPVHLEKTVMNLVSNAAEAIAGSGEVDIRTENRYLDQAVSSYNHLPEGDYVVLTVSDTGGGIPVADFDKIFEPFYTKKSMGRSGTGLGLAIVWGTVKDHKGYIDVRSNEGQGTTFTLYFPATREKLGEDVQKIPLEQYMGHGESILVVDDVPEQRQVAQTILSQLGYQVISVASGEEAVAYLKENKVDIMVLDMIMNPGIDGLDTYKLVLGINPQQKAILVSGFSETERVKGAQNLGAGAYVKKPYLKEKIGMAIREELLKVTNSIH